MSEYQIIELCKYGDFDGLITDTIMLAPISLNMNDHIESFVYQYRGHITDDYKPNDTYISLEDGVDDYEMIQKFIKQMELYGCIIPKKTTIEFGD